jgi:signal peptidase II
MRECDRGGELIVGEENPVPLVESRPCCAGRWMSVLSVIAILYAVDQATKWWTVKNFILGERRSVCGDWFEWVHFSNTGAAFGIMQDSNLFFIVLSLAAVAAVSTMLWKNVFPPGLNFSGLVLLMPGILGNFTDRLVHGYVVDFLLFDLGFWPAHPWPAFNVADSCICVSVGLMLLASGREEYDRRRTSRAP